MMMKNKKKKLLFGVVLVVFCCCLLCCWCSPSEPAVETPSKTIIDRVAVADPYLNYFTTNLYSAWKSPNGPHDG